MHLTKKTRETTMARISQMQIFSWHEIADLGDLKRLKLVLEELPDEKLMRLLEQHRKNGRNDYPVRAIWNSIIAGIVFQHCSIESLRRELERNAQLREMCGFDPLAGVKAVPSSDAYTRFFRLLYKNGEILKEIFHEVIRQLKVHLPNLGEHIAGDSKAIPSLAKKTNAGVKDGRRDKEANLGCKTYQGTKEDGTPWSVTKSWFGYKLHLLVDANYELPLDYAVSKASIHDSQVIDEIFEDLKKHNPKVLQNCKYGYFDKAYDSASWISKLYNDYAIKPIIDIRKMWKDGEMTKLLSNTTNIVYDYKGTVFCHCPVTNERKKLAFKGFEKDRNCLKYCCPSKHYGCKCEGASRCNRSIIRISLSTDSRIFTPVARSSYKWVQLYKKRTSVERVNSRLDLSFGFENHFIRGMAKMKTRCCLALTVMCTLALGRIRQKQDQLMRSLVEAA